MRRMLVVGLVALLGLAGCGGGDDSDVTLAELRTASSEADASPKCDELFADGATLPEVMPSLCRRERGDLLAVVFHTCADKRKLYQIDVTAGEAWAFERGVVTVGQDIAGDPAYGAAYEACR